MDYGTVHYSDFQPQVKAVRLPWPGLKLSNYFGSRWKREGSPENSLSKALLRLCPLISSIYSRFSGCAKMDMSHGTSLRLHPLPTISCLNEALT